MLPACGAHFVRLLEAANVRLSHKVYEGVPHGCCAEQVEALRDFLSRALPARKKAKAA